MVIHQFNKIIRNRWIWGVFAVAISAFFAFDFLLDDLQRDDNEARGADEAGTLAGERVDASLFLAIADDVRGIGSARDWRLASDEVNRQAWAIYATLKTAEKSGIEATDEEVAAAIRRDPSFQQNGAFSFEVYKQVLRANSLTPERFEASLKRRMTLMRLNRSVLASAVWTSPMELDQALADATDVMTVRVARFTEGKAAADAVTIDDKGVRAWYNENTNALFLAERKKIRYVAFDATDAKILAKMSVSEDDMRDRYDATLDRYTTKGTNDVEVTKPFDEVKGTIEKELRQLAAVEYFETNLNRRAFAVRAAKGSSRLDEIAKEDGLKVETSGFFMTDGSWKEGFSVRMGQVLPGVRHFAEAIAELDPESEDLRYAVVSSSQKVYLIELAETSPAHVPTYDEAASIIRPRALAEKREKAFKASVDAIAKKGATAVLATKDVSTNLVFTVSDLAPNTFPDQSAVARAAMTLAKGEVSDCVLTGKGRALLVVCENRVAGDAAKAMILKGQIGESLSMATASALSRSWEAWNLKRLGYTTTSLSSTEKVEEE